MTQALDFCSNRFEGTRVSFMQWKGACEAQDL